ncbi:MAG: hypothetical protein EXR63_00375 [Dehalococcoidia bacterium]|nr:hypothetical protein [Dehalococcoidia bacterium]
MTDSCALVDILLIRDSDLDKRIDAAATRLGASYSADEYKKAMEPLTNEYTKQLSELEKSAPEDLKADAKALKSANQEALDLLKDAKWDEKKVDEKKAEAVGAKVVAAETDVTAWHEKRCK